MYFSNPESNVSQFGVQVGDHVADLGAGTGRHSLALAKAVDVSGRVYAVDIQKDLLKELSSRATDEGRANIVPLVADVERGTGLEDGTMDAAVVANVLFQVEQKHAFFAEAFRILKLDGRLLVVDWSESFGGMGPTEGHVVAQEAASEMAVGVGFTFEREIRAGEHHYGLVFRKQ